MVKTFCSFCRKNFCSYRFYIVVDIRVGKGTQLATLMRQFDFSKAFDTISPSRLLQKLMSLGFSRVALSWFWWYLCSRSQCVFSRSSASEYRQKYPHIEASLRWWSADICPSACTRNCPKSPLVVRSGQKSRYLGAASSLWMRQKLKRLSLEQHTPSDYSRAWKFLV